MGIGELFAKRRPGTVPYKLFEIVRGAVLELEATPGTKVSASLELLSSQGREFVYRTGGSIDSAGTLVLRLPYSTEQAKQARAMAPYRVLVGDERYDVQVSEASVLGGRKVRLQPAQ
jgi:asparagine N-glycosylation enzyme membrane subunit Stt3